MGTIRDKFSNWKEERQLTNAEHVCIVPADLCFMSTCPMPTGNVSTHMIENIVFLSLEAASPFPPNEILWGYAIDATRSTIHIFSALKSRLRAIDPQVDFAAYILPDFIVPILSPSMTRAILRYNQRDSLFERSATNGITITSFNLSNTETASLPIFELLSVKPIREFGLTITFSRKEPSQEVPTKYTTNFPFHNAAIMAANMQHMELKKLQKKHKIATNIALYTAYIAIIAAIIGLIGLFQLRYLAHCEKDFAIQLANKDEHIKQIQLKEDRTRELDLFSNKKHAYFRGLEKINELRPETVTFQSLYASEGENFEIKCLAKTLADVEKFKKILEESGLFKVVRIEDKMVQDNQSIRFALFLTFENL
ncbi:MAG: hypothetical protein LBB11_01870 [Puniceicoccales bacterium]|jgi:Tfp pilus assembly protein PilN|nr:hypothetical protein [Puniceicoccales bacterium]